MAIKTQDELIGAHPSDGGIFEVWTQSTDKPVTAQLKHRILNIDNAKRPQAIDEIADWIILHHIPQYKLKEIAVKKRILDKYGFTNYLDNIEVLPALHNTVVGNSTEVIMSEYLKASSNMDMLVYRLHYNTNVDQAMKGDDTLFLNKEDLKEKILVGESKFKATADKQTVDKITKSIGNSSRRPLSLTFTQNRMHERGEIQLAKEIGNMQAKLSVNKTQIIDVGFILSSNKIHEQVNNNGATTNPNLVFVTIGMDDPKDFIYECANKAKEKLKQIEQISLGDMPREHAKDILLYEAKIVLSKIKKLLA